MTREEAAEIILLNDPWQTCGVCHGTGGLATKNPYTDQRHFQTCRFCKGSCRRMNPRHKMALDVLAIPIP